MQGGYVVLNNDVKMPLLGLGTYGVRQYHEIETSIDSALTHGYRLIDTAAVYKNEAHIGKCIPALLSKHNLKREDLFITTKLGPKDHGKEGPYKAVQKSLADLGMEYIDLYLIHWPGKQGLKKEDPTNAMLRKESWVAMEDVYMNSHRIRAVGVSNYLQPQMDELMTYCHVKPAVLQSEYHPDYQQEDILRLCEKNGVHFQSYSTLGCGALTCDARFLSIAQKQSKTVPQILLRWAIQNGCSVIPKSSSPQHIEENSCIFDFHLPQEDMGLIGSLGHNRKYAWDPAGVT